MKKRYTLYLFILGLGIFTAIQAGFFLDTAKKHKLPEVDFQKKVLDNGLSLIAHGDHLTEQVEIEVYIQASPLYEDSLLGTGVSHLLEHLLFKSSSKLAKTDLGREIRKLGGSINAYTSPDATVFVMNVHHSKYLQAIDLLIDFVFNAKFSLKHFEDEKQIVKHEMRLKEDDLIYRLYQKAYGALFEGHPYSVPAIGYPAYLDDLSLEDAYSYYKRMYQPSNMTMAIGGNIDVDFALQYLSKKLGGIKPGLPARSLAVFAPSLSRYPKMERFEAVDTSLHFGLMGFKVPGKYEEDATVLDFVAYILGGSRLSSLYVNLKEEKGLVYSISSSNDSLKEGGIFSVICSFEGESHQEIKTEILKEIERIKQGDFSHEFLSLVRKRIKSSYLRQLEASANRVNMLGWTQFFYKNPLFFQIYLERVDTMTKKDVMRAARKYLDEDALVFMVYEPVQKKEVQARDSVPTTQPQVMKQVFDSGVTVLVHQKKTAPLVTIRATLKGGSLYETPETEGWSNVVSELWLKGTKHKSPYEFAKFLEKKGASVDTYAGHNSVGIKLNILSEDVSDVLFLLKDMLLSPRFDEKNVSKVKQDILAVLREEEHDLFAVGFKQLKRQFYKEHPYSFHLTGNQRTIEEVTPEAIQQFYQERLNPRQLIVSVFGDIKTKETLKTLERLFGKMSGPERPMASSKNSLGAEEMTIELPKKQSLVMRALPASAYGHQDWAVFEVLTYMLKGQGGLLFDTIREQETNAYSVGSFRMSGFDPGMIVLYAFTDKDHISQVKEGMQEVIRKIKQGNVPEDLLELAKRHLAAQYYRMLEYNHSFSFQVSLDGLYDKPYDAYKTYVQDIDRVSLKDIMAVAKTYFKEDQTVTCTVLGVAKSQDEAIQGDKHVSIHS